MMDYDRNDKTTEKMMDEKMMDEKMTICNKIKKLKQLGLKLQCASLAKEYEHVFVPARVSPIIMPHNNKALKILQYARDEAHRFGVSYNRNVLKRRTLGK